MPGRSVRRYSHLGVIPTHMLNLQRSGRHVQCRMSSVNVLGLTIWRANGSWIVTVGSVEVCVTAAYTCTGRSLMCYNAPLLQGSLIKSTNDRSLERRISELGALVRLATSPRLLWLRMPL